MVGLDLTDPSIWASGIDALSDELDEAERSRPRSGSAEPLTAAAERRLSGWNGLGRVTSPPTSPHQRSSMRKVMLFAAALVVALGITASSCDDGHDGDRRHRPVRHDRRHVPAFGPGVALRDDSRPR